MSHDITNISSTELSNINDVILEALKLFEKELRDKTIKVKTELVDNPLPVLIDGEKMTLATANLIRNSFEAMQRMSKLLPLKRS